MNECVELELSISGGNFNTFQWTPAASISAQNITNPVLCLSASSAVTVRAYDLASGCNAYDTIQVLVSTNPVPQAFAGNDTILCYGDDLTLGTPGQSGYFYQWYPPLFLNDPYLPQPQAVPAYSMTYSITVTDPSTSCSSSDEIEVEVYLIEAYASSYGTICYGSTTDLEAYAYGGASSVYAYEWAPAALVQDPGSGYTQASPLSTTTFSVTVTDIVSGCADSATTLVQVDQTPAPQVDLGPDLVICTAWGEADSLRIGIPPVPGYAYEWYPHGNLSDPYSSNPWFYHNYDDHFSYSLYVTDLNSQGDCSEGYDDIDITIRYSPSLYVSPDYAEVCEGQSVQLYGYLYNLPYGTAYEAKWQPASAVTNPTSLNTQALPKDPLTFLTLSVELKDDPQTDYRRCQVSNEVILVEYPDVSLTLNELVLDCGPASDRKLPLIVDPVVGWYYWEPSDLVINDYYVGSKDTTLTLHYNSIYGCDGSAPMKVHFGDKEPPLISCPPDALLECDEDTSVAALGEANCVDNCDSLPVISHLDRLLPGNCPQSYTIQRVWYASDSTGNLDSCIQIILMEDTEPPEIFCPGDVALICPADTSPGANGIATATDVCSAFSISYTDQVYADCGGSYTVERTWRATDDCGNYSECMQVLTVQDTTPPVITCPQDVVLDCPADTSVLANGQASATDECSALTITHSDQVTYGCAHAMVVSRTWRATDDCGNYSECVQVLTVQDTTPPQITCPPDTLVTAPYGSCQQYIAMGVPLVTEECSFYDYVNTFTQTADASTFYPAGTTLVLWAASDYCGNPSTCTQQVTVRNYPVAYDDDTIVPTGATVVFPVLQ
ncbi:MAG TPA: HYR domain-containing protein, partial [Bacteroidales bacterium]|nr:HYR domain-containing protein [Bacteroidales bacterium]